MLSLYRPEYGKQPNPGLVFDACPLREKLAVPAPCLGEGPVAVTE